MVPVSYSMKNNLKYFSHVNQIFFSKNQKNHLLVNDYCGDPTIVNDYYI